MRLEDRFFMVVTITCSLLMVTANFFFEKGVLIRIDSHSFYANAGSTLVTVCFCLSTLVNELYGRRSAYFSLLVCMIALLFINFLVTLINWLPTHPWSPYPMQVLSENLWLNQNVVAMSAASFYGCSCLNLFFYDSIKQSIQNNTHPNIYSTSGTTKYQITSWRSLAIRFLVVVTLVTLLDTVLVQTFYFSLGVNRLDVWILKTFHSEGFRLLIIFFMMPVFTVLARGLQKNEEAHSGSVKGAKPRKTKGSFLSFM